MGNSTTAATVLAALMLVSSIAAGASAIPTGNHGGTGTAAVGAPPAQTAATGATASGTAAPGTTQPASLLRVDDPTAEDFDACYVVGQRSARDYLEQVNTTTANTTEIGPTGQGTQIRDMAFQPGTGVLFGVDGRDQLGTLDLGTGAFTARPQGFGVGNGADGAETFDRIEAMSFDPTTGVLYAVHSRPNARDLLFQVDPDTGAHVEDAFGVGVDYVVIPQVSGGLDDIDGLAVSPAGEMFAIFNDPGASDNIGRINKTTGASTNVGEAGTNNLEGLTFDLQGNLWATTTSAGGQTQEGNSLWSIDTSTGTATRVGKMDLSKYEAIACGLGGPGQSAADLSLDKSVNRSAVPQGEDVAFTITVTNSGPDDTANVTVDDALPAGLTFVSASGDGSYDSGTGTWTIGALPNGSTATLSIVATASGTVGDTVENIAEVATSDVEDPDSDPGDGAGDDWDNAVVTIAEPNDADLSLVKTVDDPVPAPGATVTYTLTVTNGGPQVANLTVTDGLPAGVSFVSASGDGSYDSGTGNWTVSSLGAGESATLAITADVTGAPGDVVTNDAEVTESDRDDPDSTPGDGEGDDYDDATLTVTAADLGITKTVDNSTVVVGDQVTFTVTLTNAGPSDATGIEVEDVLPAGLDYVSDTATLGGYDNATGIWGVASLPAETSATLTITAEATAAGTYDNVAAINASDQFDQNADNDSDTATVTVRDQEADLGVTKTVNQSTVTAGDDVQFTVTVTNDGPDPATSVTVDDQLPAGLSYVSHNAGAGTSYDPNTGVWSVGDLGVEESATLTIVASADAAGTYENTAAINRSDQTDPNGQNDEDSSTVTVEEPTQEVDLAVDKSVDDDTPFRGDTIDFTLSVTNNGPDDATGVVLDDPLPAGLTYVSQSGDGTYDETTGEWTVGSVPAQATRTITLTVRVNTDDPVVNTLTLDRTDQVDTNDGNDQDEVLVTPEGNADLSVNKTANRTVVPNNEEVQFTINVTNDGPSDASVVVNDTLPVQLNFLSATPSQGTYDSATGVWDVGTLPNGSTATLLITAREQGSDPGNVSNVAQVAESNRSDPDSTPGNNVPGEDDQDSTELEIENPDSAGEIDLELTKTVTNTGVGTCEKTTYTISVTNNASTATTTASEVAVVDNLPAGVDVVSATPETGSFDLQDLRWSIGSIEPGETFNLTIRVNIEGEVGSVQNNIAQVDTALETDVDSLPGNDLASEDDQDSANLTVQEGLTGFISGRVSDQNNDDVPNALVVVRDSETGELVATTLTDSEGDYTVEVVEGTYDVQVSKEGFSSVGRTDVFVPCNKTASVNVVIRRQQVPTTIDVTPPSDSALVGDTNTFTVTVRDQNEEVLEGVTVEAVSGNADITFESTSDGGASGTTASAVTDENGQATFTVTSGVVAQGDIQFTAIGGENPTVNATKTFVQNGDGSIQGTVINDRTTNPVENASVWAVLADQYLSQNTYYTEFSVGGPGSESLLTDDDDVYFVRLVDNSTGEVIDNDEYDFRVADYNTSDTVSAAEGTAIRKIDALNNSDESVGSGYALIDKNNDGTVAFTHTRLAPEEYYAQVSLDATNADDDTDDQTPTWNRADNGAENFLNASDAVAASNTDPPASDLKGAFAVTGVGNDAVVFRPAGDLTLEATEQRAEQSGANLVDSPGFVNSYGVDTDGTTVAGQYKLNRLYSDFQEGRAYIAIATKVGFSTDFADVYVEEDGELVGEEGQSSVDFNLQPEPVEPDAVNVTQVGLHPPLSETGGAPDPTQITLFDEVNENPGDDIFQLVPRDGTVDVIEIETLTEEGERINGTVTFEIVEDGGNLNSTFALLPTSDDTITDQLSGNEDAVEVNTGDDGVATVLYIADRGSEDVDANKTAVLVTDAGAVDSSNATFVGQTDFQSASISGITTDRDDTRVPQSVVYVDNFVLGDRNTPNTSDRRFKFEPLTSASPDTDAFGQFFLDQSNEFAVKLQVFNSSSQYETVRQENVTIEELDNYDFDDFESDFPSVNVLPGARQGDATGFDFYDNTTEEADYTLDPLPAQDDLDAQTFDEETDYEVEAVRIDDPDTQADNNAGIVGVDANNGLAELFVNTTDDANLVFPFQVEQADFELSNLQAPDQVTEGESFDVSVTVTNVAPRGFQDINKTVTFGVDTDDDGSLETLLSQNVEVAPETSETVTFTIPEGTTNGLTGTFVHGVSVPAEGETLDATITIEDTGSGDAGSPSSPDVPSEYLEDGVVTTDRLQTAIQDWAQGEISTDTLNAVIQAWATA